MESPWTPGQAIWPFRPWVLFARRVLALCVGGFVSLLLMSLGYEHLSGFGTWLLFAAFALGLGGIMMRRGLHWARQPALTLSWDGIGIGVHRHLIPWSSVSAVSGHGPIFITLHGGQSLATPWRTLGKMHRESLVEHMRSRHEEWAIRRALNLPVPCWTLKSCQLEIRPWCRSDLSSFHRVYSDPALLVYQDYGALDRYEARSRLHHVTALENRSDAFSWTRAIVATESGLVIGHLDLWMTRLSCGVARVGYGIFPEYQGQGLMSESLLALATTAVEDWGITTIEATVRQMNVPSRKVLNRVGFRRMTTLESPGVELWCYGRAESE